MACEHEKGNIKPMKQILHISAAIDQPDLVQKPCRTACLSPLHDIGYGNEKKMPEGIGNFKHRKPA